ncbi:GH39 family glycosyl hydrolase [Mangrovibacterium lignilyticum]|uniref:GH39 family glycosyl hydrolase n=1 Tax=Mangrovibacterium lignilyticum TaxID=2668052 RepID=UPI0013D08529|nr:glycoside hydrolase [Mangrovibacterium lignilyticum]
MKISSVVFCLAIFLSMQSVLAQSNSGERLISVNLQNEKGPMNTMFKECIGAGRANEGLRADWQQQLEIVKQDCDFKYIRMHGLLTDDMAVYKEDRQGNPVYNFQYIDVLYDYILEIGMKPFVELGFMPNALASGDQTIFWWRGNVTPPKDYNKWEALIRNLVQHWTDRYGEEEVKTWYFEVWNEPNLSPGFWTGTQDEYFKLYQYAAQGVKAVNPAYKVGGPATAGAAWVPETIAFCEKNNVPIDFISTHSYGVDVGFLDEFGGTGTRLSANDRAVSQDVINSRKQITESTKPQLELHYTEWSSSYTPADPIHDSYHEAAYILNKIKQIGDAATSMSYWVFTDIFEEPGPRFTPFHGGFGLMNTQGIKKPAYQAYALLNKLGDTELANTDDKSWACKNEQGNFQLLLWDYTYTLPDDSINNQDYYIRNLPAKSKGSCRVSISGVPQGNYQLEVYQVGYMHNDPYSLYDQLGKPSQLSKQQVEFLKESSNGMPEKSELVKVKADGSFEREIPLHENDVYLLRFRKL